MQRKIDLSRIKSSISNISGLETIEVIENLKKYGANNILEKSTNAWIELIKNTSLDPMIWFLIATSLLFAILQDYNQTIILLLATIPLIGMDAFLHWRTQLSTKNLSGSLATEVNVIRNGIEVIIAAVDIVPGDLVVISEGNPFPADGIIVGGKDLKVDESLLTGESFPVTKLITPKTYEHDYDKDENYYKDSEYDKNYEYEKDYNKNLEPIIPAKFLGFAGTRLLTGKALLRVVYTGQETIYGEITNSTIHSTTEKTPLQIQINKLVFILVIVATVICLILAFVRFYQGFGIIDALLSAATLAVAALPDEFPVVFTFFIGMGVYSRWREIDLSIFKCFSSLLY